MEELNYIYPPPKFLPYMEKYRIYELFQSLAAEVIIAKPDDHVVFLKSVLMKMAKNGRDLRKVFLIASPKSNINVQELAFNISRRLDLVLLTRDQILEPYKQIMVSNAFPLQADALAGVVQEKLKASPYNRKGWIMYDYPATPEEAFSAQRAGILPTCSLHVVAAADSAVEPQVQGSATQELSRVYHATLREIRLEETRLCDLESVCCEAVNKRRPSGMPCVYRVVLLGPSGCGRHVQARSIADLFHLVHVNFVYLYRQAGLRTDAIGRKIQGCKMTYADIVEILHRRLYQKDCLEQGWILTHFPRNVMEFEVLDRMDTPPNRVIFLTLPEQQCKKSIIEHDLRGLFQYSEFGTRCKLNEVEEYFRHEYNLKKYCGETAVAVDATGTVEHIQTGIQAAIMTIPTADLVRGSDLATDSIGDFSSFDYLLNMETESMMGEARFITE